MPRRGSVGENGIGVTSYPINDCTSLFAREKGTVRLRYAGDQGHTRALSSTVRAYDSSHGDSWRKLQDEKRVNSGKPKERKFHGNPEPSPGYTQGRCRD